jgi:hypothetical protein
MDPTNTKTRVEFVSCKIFNFITANGKLAY